MKTQTGEELKQMFKVYKEGVTNEPKTILGDKDFDKLAKMLFYTDLGYNALINSVRHLISHVRQLY